MTNLASAQPLPAPLLSVDFDELARGHLPPGVAIHTQFRAPDVVPGIIGSAWRTDGFSSYAQAALPLDPNAGFSLSLWVTLESFPSDLEVPVKELSPSSFAQQAQGDAGFDLHVDTFGRWGFRIATSAGVLRVSAPRSFPLRRWVHLVASVDPASGVVSLYQDGALIGTATGKAGMSLRLAPVPLKLATPAVEARILDFKVNRLNGAFDLVEVYPAALSAPQLASLPGPGTAPDAEPSLVVPASRFAADALRPRVHAMPAANWTNEPHGLVRVGQAWHLFYQRTPNGPFKTQMHWGHMVSRDLVTWEHLPDALWPELQTADSGFDMKGIWSGHVITDGGKAFAFYTSVNHGERLSASNPGVSMAVSEDADLRDWRKLGPVLNTQGIRDFRDPFLWKQGDTWHMIVGAALETGGGLQYYVLRRGEKGARWQPQRFSDTAYRLLDIGSEIWEMPVFEQLTDQVWVLVVNPVGGKVSKYGEPPTRTVYWTGEWVDGRFKPFFRTPQNLDLLPGHLAPTVGRAADGQLRAIGIIDERRSPAAQLRAGWAHTFSLPRVWKLLPDRRTVGQAPAPELQALRGEPLLASAPLALGPRPRLVGDGMHAYELLIDLDDEAASAGPVVVDLMASADGREFTRLRFDPAEGSVAVDKSQSSLSADGEGPQRLQGGYAGQAFGPMRQLRIFVDGSAIEVFVNDAAAYAVRSYPSLPGSTQVRLSTLQPARARVQIWPLRPPG
ncbi:MAG TPA: GH32 C-terminal domain-containing protein [Ideonella sp.]|uniref:LamG-like jellyroll fold domain-containing protein n=1 Tax=Ideonella sp. TaxID=1929293 RepID=UPI002B601BAF|nr:GH32 C-terminal domain-containing protein [Ideonella sp.]HSI47940.1 GH32 C-terminal domain-containing protein [Ideonella sp.]